MFSKRLKTLVPYKTETTKTKVKLSSNESPFDISSSLKEKLKKALDNISFNRYPDPYATKLRNLLADILEIDPENLLITNASDEGIYYLILAIEREQKVIYPFPSFPMYKVGANVFGNQTLEMDLDESFQIEKNSLKKALNEKDGIVFISNPNNPTGNLFKDEDIESFIEKGFLTVIDEAYFDFSEKTYKDTATKKDNVIVLRTLSKIGLASLRVGIIIGTKEVIKELSKIKLPFNVSATSQEMAYVVLKEGMEEIKNNIKVIKEERERVFKELQSFKNIRPYPSSANFFLIEILKETPGYIHKKLIEKGVLVRDISYLKGLEKCLRVSVGTPSQNDTFLEKLKEITD